MPGPTAMPTPDLAFVIALLVLGLAGYLLSGRKSKTALIPCVFALVFSGMALVFSDSAKGGARSVANLAIASLGLIATVRSIGPLLSAGVHRKSIASSSLFKGLMALACAAYIGWSLL